ncbi:cation acetate symporter [Streptomyces avermitilis]|uniref:sodium/solute symporter n=1 Tax=Streptomyces avermitilis TaxID=33903 RepID=UPI0033B14877
MVSIVACLALCLFSAEDIDDGPSFYIGKRTIAPWRLGSSISGDYVSVITVLNTTGLVALQGFDGIAFLAGTSAGLILALLIVAEPMRKSGKFTTGDVVASRFSGQALRIGVAIVTIGVAATFLLMQIAVVGRVTAFVLGRTDTATQAVCTVIVGALIVYYAPMGGMRGTVTVQIFKTGLLLCAIFTVIIVALNRFDWNIYHLLVAAEKGSGLGYSYLAPGNSSSSGVLGAADRFSLPFTATFAVLTLPHMTMRFFAAPDERSLRTAMRWSASLTTVLCAGLIVIGISVAALVGKIPLYESNPSGEYGALLLAAHLDDRGFILAVVATAVFVTALAGIAGAVMSAASSLARDLYSQGIRNGKASTSRELLFARWSALLIGALGTLAASAISFNVHLLFVLGITLGASVLTPVVLYTLFWKGFTRAGALWCIYGSAVITLTLLALSPLASGNPGALFPSLDFDYFPLRNPGLVTVPSGFVLGWLVSKVEGGNKKRSAPPARMAHEYSHEYS